MKKLIIILMVAVLCPGCVRDDISDIKVIAETDQAYYYRYYYTAGISRGLTTCGVLPDTASEMAEEITIMDMGE